MLTRVLMATVALPPFLFPLWTAAALPEWMAFSLREEEEEQQQQEAWKQQLHQQEEDKHHHYQA